MEPDASRYKDFLSFEILVQSLEQTWGCPSGATCADCIYYIGDEPEVVAFAEDFLHLPSNRATCGANAIREAAKIIFTGKDKRIGSL